MLIVSIQSAMTDEEWVRLRATLAARVRERRSTGVVIDVGSLDVVDSYAGRMLQSIARSMDLSGVQVVVAGIAPDVAYSMVLLGLDLEGIDTALDLDEALVMLRT
jgi:rsbT antagonist protein RsbS